MVGAGDHVRVQAVNPPGSAVAVVVFITATRDEFADVLDAAAPVLDSMTFGRA
jgi:hypothetical protein